MSTAKVPLMQYSLMGFTQPPGFRVFQYDAVAKDGGRVRLTVSVELALLRKHSIRVQEVPLMCVGILEKRDMAAGQHAFTFTEEWMSEHAAVRTAQAMKKKPGFRPQKARTPFAPGDFRFSNPGQANTTPVGPVIPGR